MTALNPTTVHVRAFARGDTAFEGFGVFFRKELLEWLRSRRAILLTLATGLMMLPATLGSRIALLSAAASHVVLPTQPPLDPTVNVLMKWDQWVFFFAILVSVSLVIGERDRGTLAWSLSKPLSRTALLAAKWSAAMVMFSIFGLVLPMTASVIVAIPAYGMPDLAVVATATVLLVATPAFFFALTLALGVILPSQTAVGGLAIMAAVVPGLVGQVLPDLAAAFPSSIGPWAVGLARGVPVPAITPIGWLVGTSVAAIAGLAAFQRRDL